MIPLIEAWPYVVAAFGVGSFVQQMKNDIRDLQNRVGHLETDMHEVKTQLKLK